MGIGAYVRHCYESKCWDLENSVGFISFQLNLYKDLLYKGYLFL